MNPMLAALQKSRAAAPSENEAPENEGDDMPSDGARPIDLNDVLDKLESVEAKLDKIFGALSLSQDEGDAAPEKDAKETPPNDDGY